MVRLAEGLSAALYRDSCVAGVPHDVQWAAFSASDVPQLMQ